MRMTLSFLVLVGGLAVAPLAAQEPTRGRGEDNEVFEHLGLTPDQRVKIKAIRNQVKQENAPLREQIKQILGGKRFRDLTPAERASLKPQFDPIRKQMKENRRKGRDQIRVILTPDQLKQFEHEMHQHRGPRDDRDGPPS